MAKRESIVIGDNISNLRIFEIINECFGKEYTGWMKAWYDVNDEYAAWFPKMSEIGAIPNGTYGGTRNYSNAITSGGLEIIETCTNPKIEADGTYIHDNKKRLVFGRINGCFKFLGIFKYCSYDIYDGKAIMKYSRIARGMNLITFELLLLDGQNENASSGKEMSSSPENKKEDTAPQPPVIINGESLVKDKPHSEPTDNNIRARRNNVATFIELREINKLIKEQYYIPTYQRGYRWDESQVTDLLEDIHEFINKGNVQAGEFYCLQPIVVKKREDGKFDVIDGQQRLTSFMIIQKYLGKRTYHIEYASREGSSDFLDNIREYVEEGKEKTTNNIDFFFMTQAYNTVKTWFEAEMEDNDDYTILDEFNTYLGKYCKVIWYEVDDDADAESIFTRLNIGKIPLTNAELIKALFLKKSNFKDMKEAAYLRQLEIANEWDEIENTLQNNKVWYFINPQYDNVPATRIEYLFDIISNKSGKENENYTFIEFAKKFESGSTDAIESVWNDVKNHFQIIMEWYEDQYLYHLIGFLTSSSSGITVTQLIKEYYSGNYKKDEFVEYINGRIRRYFQQIDIDDLSYDYKPDQAKIKDVLLLFNVITVMNKSNAYSRFPFDSYNKNKAAWSLEHIHAQNAEGMGNSKDVWLAWIDEHIKSFKQFSDVKYHEIVLKLEAIDRDTLDWVEFESIFNDICSVIKDDYGENLDRIDNMALLDRNANSSISNNFFDVKRSMIIEKDRNGEFIPVCTRNVFLKYYSKDPSQIHYWSESDRQDYLERIKETLAKYIECQIEEEDKNED